MSGEANERSTSIEPAEYRRVLGHLATGVTVVATADGDGRAWGLTASAVTSLSLDPPLVLVCVDLEADSHDVLDGSGRFAVSILGDGSESLARRFAEYDADGKWEGVAYRAEVTGAPVLDGALAWVDCRVTARHPGGDHTIFVGEVVAGDAGEGAPLLYYRGGYGRLAP
jgi:flavin reductase (DIM6/NTAB) family NADH-FMN oxidoreductase RutF